MTFALLVALLLNGTSTTALVEDAPIVTVMGAAAIAALNEAHPECKAIAWQFNRDASDGLSVIATGSCEYAGWFYLAPDGDVWTFTVEGA